MSDFVRTLEALFIAIAYAEEGVRISAAGTPTDPEVEGAAHGAG